MLSTSLLSRAINISQQSRSYAAKVRPGAVPYGLVNYYPRHPDHVDPPITPTKLLMVQRVKPYMNNPYWHKRVLNEFKLNGLLSNIAVVKNSPENCEKLWRIKHLIKVTPIRLPDHLPEADSAATVLHENGDLLLAPRIDPERERLTKKFLSDPKRLDRETLSAELRMRWLLPYDT